MIREIILFLLILPMILFAGSSIENGMGKSVRTLETTPIHKISNREPHLKLVKGDAGNIYRYEETTPFWAKVTILSFMGILLLLSLIKGKRRGTVAILISMGILYMMFHLTEEEKTVFDLNKRLFHKGDLTVSLDDINAFQILKDRACDTDPNSHFKTQQCYDTYELNIALKDDRRINIVCHGNYEQIRDDATRLSKVLGKPVLDEIK